MNFKKEMSLIISSIVVFLFVMAGCAADATDGNNVAKKSKYSAETLRMMRQLSTLEMPEGITLGTPEGISEELDTDGTEEPVVEVKNDITYITTTKKFKLSASFDTQILLDPASEVIYPGSVILGHTINDGRYAPVVAGTTKRPVTLSYDLVGVGKLSDTIVPTKSRYTNLHNEIMSQYIPQQSTVYSFEQTQLRNEDEFNLKFSLGAGFGVGPVKADIKSAFSFGSGEEKSNYMIKFMQTFYTVNLDVGDAGFLYEDFDIEAFEGYRPVYVSSIAYGRVAYLAIQTDKKWTQLKSDLTAAVDAANYGNYETEFSTGIKKLFENTTTNIVVIGGAGETVTNAEEFMNFIKNYRTPTTENPGKIISYKLRFVDNNELANVVFNGDYTATVTEEVQGNGYLVSLKAKKIVNSTGGKADFYGDLSWKDSTNTDTYATLWGFPNKSTFKTVQGENVVGYKMPGFINFYESHSFAAKTDQFTIELSGLKKDRFLLSDHEFDGVTKIMQISSLCTQGFEFYDGYWTGEFTIKAPRTGGKNSEFVEITVGYEVQKAN